ncbi:cell division protein FtsZ [soil metagenome]
MIQLSRNYTLPEQEDELIPIKVIGVGGAGSNVLDRAVLDGFDKSDLVAANTDVQSLASSVSAHKVQLGRMVTRGLGGGGDPEIGYEAAVEAADEIRQSLVDARMIFICAGLGGGTGSGAAPVVAEIARDSGALVVSFATMPFSFEGKRRTAQAQEALGRLERNSDAVICFENDKMGDIVAPKAGVHQAFAAADLTLSQSVRSIIGLIQRPGLIRIGFDDLLSALRATNSRCLFGYGESDSDNRSHDALTQALKNPLMDRGRLLEDTANLLVQVAGGPGMTLSDVEILMHELNRHIGDDTQILFGTAVDGRMGNRLAVTLISSLSADGVVAAKPAQRERVPEMMSTPPPTDEPRLEPAPPAAGVEAVEAIEEEEFIVPPVEQRPLRTIEAVIPQPELVDTPEFAAEPELAAHSETPSEPEIVQAPVDYVAPEPIQAIDEDLPQREPKPEPPRLILPKKKAAPVREPKAPVEKVGQAKQEVLQFESVTRGRFEKSEPTIVEGQDLDVPTFLRKNVRVK